MTTTITFHLVAIPDPPPDGVPAGTTVLDVSNTFTMSDADSNLMLAAFQQQFTERGPRDGSVPVDAIPLVVPGPDECVTRACSELWASLKSATDRYYQKLVMQQAEQNLRTVTAVQETTVNVKMEPTTP